MGKLVIGGGYLGRRIAFLWLANGQRVFVTTRSRDRAAEFRRLGLEPIICDVLKPASLKALPAVNCAVYCVGFDRGLGKTMREVYVGGLANVLTALPPPCRFIHISSTGVYGQCAGEDVDELSATEPLEESGRIVLDAERLVHGKLPGAIILRFAGIYGPSRLIRSEALLAGEALVVDPEKWLNLIHVDDGATAAVAAETHASPGQVYNICDDRPVRRREFFELLVQLLGAPEPRFIPAAPGTPQLAHQRTNRRLVNRRMRSELGVQLRYPSFEEGLRNCIPTK